MIIILYIIGSVGLTISAVVGFVSGSFTSFLASMAGGFSTALIFYALARILQVQTEILYKLEQQEESQRRSQRNENKVCPNCNNTYDDECSSCPYCGHR